MKRIALIALIVVAVVFVYGRYVSQEKTTDYSAPVDVQHPKASAADIDTGNFGICGRGRDHCVIDGDTFILDHVHVRIADIDAPEIGGAKCEYEHELGLRAKSRLAELLSEGPFRLQTIDRDIDRYGRKLRVVTRNGHSLGDDLIKEGLARSWGGSKKPWC